MPIVASGPPVPAPANFHELRVLDDLSEGVQGWVIGDRNYWGPDKWEELALRGIRLLAPYKSAKREKEPWSQWLVQMR